MDFLKNIEISLRRFPNIINNLIFHRVIVFLRPNIQYETDGEEVEIRQGQTDLQTPEEEKRCSYFPVARTRFFLDSTSVMRLVPHSSRISGRIS